MAIPIIKPTIGPSVEGLTHPSEIFSFPGLTTQGNIFLHDLQDDSWYIFDPTTGGTDGAYVEIDTTLTDLKNSSESYQIETFYNSVRNHIETTSRTFGYESSLEFISYRDSGITSWREESLTFSEWRDNTLTLMYQNIASFTGGGPALDDLNGFTSQVGYYAMPITPSRPQLFS